MTRTSITFHWVTPAITCRTAHFSRVYCMYYCRSSGWLSLIEAWIWQPWGEKIYMLIYVSWIFEILWTLDKSMNYWHLHILPLKLQIFIWTFWKFRFANGTLRSRVISNSLFCLLRALRDWLYCKNFTIVLSDRIFSQVILINKDVNFRKQ